VSKSLGRGASNTVFLNGRHGVLVTRNAEEAQCHVPGRPQTQNGAINLRIPTSSALKVFINIKNAMQGVLLEVLPVTRHAPDAHRVEWEIAVRQRSSAPPRLILTMGTSKGTGQRYQALWWNSPAMLDTT